MIELFQIEGTRKLGDRGLLLFPGFATDPGSPLAQSSQPLRVDDCLSIRLRSGEMWETHVKGIETHSVYTEPRPEYPKRSILVEMTSVDLVGAVVLWEPNIAPPKSEPPKRSSGFGRRLAKWLRSLSDGSYT